MGSGFVRVLGSADWHQTAFNDHSCYTVDDKILIDACPSVVTQLLEHGVDPLDITTVCFTHMHCDHTMGLMPLFHYWRVCLNDTKDLSRYTIIGPKATLKKTFDIVVSFIFGSSEELAQCVHKLPRFVELEGCSGLDIPGYHISTMDSEHAVPGLCYRIDNLETGHSVGFTGDTAYLEELPVFFENVDLLLHEASFGGVHITKEINRACRHSSAHEAVEVCKKGNVKRLLLTHAYEPKREAAIAAARRQLDIPVGWAVPHQTFEY